MKNPNPFLITGYSSPAYFCNRAEETATLREAMENARNITLFSPRRMGKTGLIHHFFNTCETGRVNAIYLDIFGTGDLNGFIKEFANKALQAGTTNKEKFISRALDFFSRLRPQISYNQLTGTPEVSFRLETEADRQATLAEIFRFLEDQKRPNFIAIDEFQQINHYPEKNTGQILRSHIQQLKNNHFIFSGSQRHLLLPMFTDPERPFYQSGSFLSLDKLDRHEYQTFISGHFNRNGQKISDKTTGYILDWTKNYTFYTQYFCNKLFSKRLASIDESGIREVINEIFAERETIYYNYRNLLTSHQFGLLKAIALEDSVTEPTSQAFIRKYDLGNPSTVRKSLMALLNKELIYESAGETKQVYQVYDVFLSRWIGQKWQDQ